MNSNLSLSAPLYITGQEPHTGKLLLGGVFQMHDTVGFPVDSCIEEAERHNLLIDWLEAYAACWLNDCLKLESFDRQVSSQLPNSRLMDKFHVLCASILEQFPKIKQHNDPVNVVCRYVIKKKQRHSLFL